MNPPPPKKTFSLDELTNLELWGAKVDFLSPMTRNGQFRNHPNMGFHPTTANPCVIMRENLKPTFCDTSCLSR